MKAKDSYASNMCVRIDISMYLFGINQHVLFLVGSVIGDCDCGLPDKNTQVDWIWTTMGLHLITPACPILMEAVMERAS